MKTVLRTLFAPLLNLFESGDEPYNYKPSHRTILVVIGFLFSGLAGIVFSMVKDMDPSYLLPVIVFGGVGFISLLVGTLGNDRAVAKIWNSRR